jgi:tetratricopeptide (TPR) repeat protein
VEGTLSKSEEERFEEHYFDCPVCLEYLEAVEAVASQLEQNPVKVEPVPARQLTAGWRWAWVFAGATVVIAIGFVSFIGMQHPTAPSVLTVKAPVKTQAPEVPRPTEKVSVTGPAQLADVAIPAYTAMALRGESRDEHFLAGMKAYQAGGYGEATTDLAQVPAESRDGLTARFYLGACQMHLNQLNRASATLNAIVAAGDSPEQEAALYYLAQIALVRHQVAEARMYLSRTIELHGDFEARARSQQHKLAAAIERKIHQTSSR